jgi:competence ComEA-like helix-hairpin-helix protein
MICRRAAWFWLILVVIVICAPQVGFAKKKPPLHPVNLNTASALELEQVPGIGPSTADKILQMRKSYGAFKSVDDLLAIKGIGPKKLDKMRKYLRAGTAAPVKHAATPASTQGKAPPGKSVAVKPAAVAPQKKVAEPKSGEEEEP